MRAKVWLYPGMAGWHFVTLPKKQSAEIKKSFGELTRGWGSLPVMVTILWSGTGQVGKTSWKNLFFQTRKQEFIFCL